MAVETVTRQVQVAEYGHRRRTRTRPSLLNKFRIRGRARERVRKEREDQVLDFEFTGNNV